MSAELTRYEAWHISEPGFKTEEDAAAWISNQDRPEDYFVVAAKVPRSRVSDAEKAMKEMESIFK